MTRFDSLEPGQTCIRLNKKLAVHGIDHISVVKSNSDIGYIYSLVDTDNNSVEYFNSSDSVIERVEWIIGNRISRGDMK